MFDKKGVFTAPTGLVAPAALKLKLHFRKPRTRLLLPIFALSGINPKISGDHAVLLKMDSVKALIGKRSGRRWCGVECGCAFVRLVTAAATRQGR